VDELFTPPGASWRRVSSRLTLVRRSMLAGATVVLVALAVGWWLFGPLPAPVLAGALAVGAVVLAWAWWVVGRSVQRWGYAELEHELYITRGALIRRLVAVPYARMQFVDVHAGPADQLAGIARVRLHTASPGTSAVIPGLPADEAARLRDRLTSRSDTSAGL
jgi:membrane protein YdbS with pleckstrin-like domain